MDSGESGGPLMLVNSERKLVTSIAPNQGKAALIVSNRKAGFCELMEKFSAAAPVPTLH